MMSRRTNIAPRYEMHFARALLVSIRRGMSAGAALFLLLVGSGASAQEVAGYPSSILALDPREVALLPRYCLYTQYFRRKLTSAEDKAHVQQWYARLGPTFEHMHHYCWGLMKTNRANLLARDHATQVYYLTDAIMEFDYVIERSPADFPLLPEFLTKKAENLLLLDKAPVAIYQFEQAIELNGTYWPPYAGLSDYYKGLGDLKKAREYLEAGLAQSPDARGLQRRLSELGSTPGGGGTKR